MSSPARASEIRFALFWCAVSLLGIYVVTVAVAAVPMRLLDPAWIERVCTSLRAGVSFPLIALMLMLVGAHLLEPQRQGPYLPRLSRLAYLAALGFLLMIPLQSWASVTQLQQLANQERDQLRLFTRGLERIRLSLTEEQLSDAIASIPGAPRFVPGTLTVPLPQARQMLIRQIEPQLRLSSTQLQKASSRRWQEALPRMIKEALVAFFAALGFAAVGRPAADRPTLLRSLLAPRTRYLRTLDPHVAAMAEEAAAAELAADDPTQDRAPGSRS